MAIQTNSRTENKVKWVQDGEDNDHLPCHKLGLDLVGDPERGDQADNTVIGG